jgi:transposase InsO family protein
MDLSGKILPASFGGALYYFEITDLYIKYHRVYLLNKKSQAFNFFLKYYAKVTNHHSANINPVVFDGGGEFNSKEFLSFLSEKGVQVQVTAPHTPQQNAVAKRGNRTTSKKARAML